MKVSFYLVSIKKRSSSEMKIYSNTLYHGCKVGQKTIQVLCSHAHKDLIDQKIKNSYQKEKEKVNFLKTQEKFIQEFDFYLISGKTILTDANTSVISMIGSCVSISDKGWEVIFSKKNLNYKKSSNQFLLNFENTDLIMTVGNKIVFETQESISKKQFIQTIVSLFKNLTGEPSC